jgi:uncharacterized membrane protein YgcG
MRNKKEQKVTRNDKMPPYQTPELGEAPKEMKSEADRVYKGLRETKFVEENPSNRESAARVMWSVLKKTWTKEPKTGKWVKKQTNLGTTYDDGPSSVVSDYAGAMELIAVGTDDRPDYDYDQDELALGIQTEMEHTGNGEIAARIAKDHLDEDPRYYSKMREYHLSMHNMALSSIYDIGQTRKSLVAMKGTGDHLVEYDLQKAIDGLDHAKTVAEMIVNGGPGSGNFGHEGRPGEVGGSGDGGSSSSSGSSKSGKGSSSSGGSKQGREGFDRPWEPGSGRVGSPTLTEVSKAIEAEKKAAKKQGRPPRQTAEEKAYLEGRRIMPKDYPAGDPRAQGTKKKEAPPTAKEMADYLRPPTQAEIDEHIRLGSK